MTMTRAEFLAAIQKQYPHLSGSDADYITSQVTTRARHDDGITGAVTAYVRHHYTDYDALLGEDASEEHRKKIRSQVRPALDEALHYFRTGHGRKPARRQATRHMQAAKPPPQTMEECTSRTQFVKYLAGKYGGWKPQLWTAEEADRYENWNKSQNQAAP